VDVGTAAFPLAARGLSVSSVTDALARNNANAGGGAMERGGERILVRSVGVATSAEDVERIPVATKGGTPILVRDVATVGVGTPVATGLSIKDGKEAIVAVDMMLKGANGRTVAQALDAKLSEIRTQLPRDVRLTTVYNRAVLVNKTVGVVAKSLIEGGLLVVVVMLLLGNLRRALIVAATMSALDAVRGIAHGALRDLGQPDEPRGDRLRAHCRRRGGDGRERGSPSRRAAGARGAHAPARGGAENGRGGLPRGGEAHRLRGVDHHRRVPTDPRPGGHGRMFRPMPLTVVFALLGALLLTLTLVPTLASMLLSGDTREGRNPIMALYER